MSLFGMSLSRNFFFRTMGQLKIKVLPNDVETGIDESLDIFWEISFSILEKYELSISLSLFETGDKNFKFLFLLSNLR